MSAQPIKITNTATTAVDTKLLKTISTTAVKSFVIGLIIISLTHRPAVSGLHLSRGVDINAVSQPSPVANSTMDFLLRALDGLDKSLSFFQTELKSINLDAVIGTRIVQASLKVLLDRLVRFDLLDSVPSYVISHIKKLRDVAGEVSDLATPYIAANEAEYYNRIGPILSENLFALDYDSRDVMEGALLWAYNRKEEMQEFESDECLAEVFGTRNGVPCDMSNRCWRKMTKLGYNRYSLSHQIFYLEIAEMTGCAKEMQWHLLLQQQPTLTALHDTFCANMLAEANLIADNNFPPKVQDLFMEQAALCGMLGYREFFNSDWLMKILSWQDPQDGCYRWAGWPEERDEDKISDLTVQPSRRLYKREERRVAKDCLCHRTAVAASALSQYVRFVLEVWLDEHLY
ncbi:hypothetical protein RRG08_030457 [Elysia crispata]|uniref:Uncharacterized protein n=1 Tax=Elysia crispata TaxID=231223 RepID=A0AAE1B1N8_9GAST|nr:hypothetical protein RRG08_030457 [Elysia crispata]